MGNRSRSRSRSRPRRVAIAALAAALAVGATVLHPAAAGDGDDAAPEPAPDVAAALGWLAKQQQISGGFGRDDQLALTGMAGLAFLASGSTPEHGPYAKQVRDAVGFILRTQRRDGAFVHPSSGYSAIHNHGFATLFLAEVYGEGTDDLDERLGQAVRRALEPLGGSQHGNGGYGYFLYKKPPPRNVMWEADEASTTIAVLQAMRSARNAGVEVDRRVLRKAADYIARSQHQATGGFVYSIGSYRVNAEEGGTVPSFAVSAACTAVLHALGRYEGKASEQAVRFLERFTVEAKGEAFWYYGHYYAAQVMHMEGGESGQRWVDGILAALVERQRADGGWPADATDTLHATNSRILNTAFAIQVALIRASSLPIHER